ncbi:MAG TPA: CvpA family protein [Sedimentisphaerales bacterium]|nr:CvpA family protein [Sedimentisphaerales bacterium]
MVDLIVVLIVLGCAALLYLKGTLVKAFATLIIAVCASVVAFGYFELLANVFIGRELLMPWAQPLSFALLFILTFAVLQTAAIQLIRQPVDLGLWPERIGRVVCGIFLGLFLSGLLLTALAMAPIPNKYPYQRFEERYPDAEHPNKVLLNPDGLVAGLFSTISSGSFSGKRSFATLHPAFINQSFLNRHNTPDGVPSITKSQAIEVLRKNAAWYAPEGIKDSDGNPVSPKSGYILTIVRIGIKQSAVVQAGTFTPAQLRLICKQQADAKNPLAGKGQIVYPVGYLAGPDLLQTKRLSDVIKVTRSDFDANARTRWIDFAFYVPAGFVPVLVEFKQNSIAEVPPLVTAEQAPPPEPFVPSSEREKPASKPGNPSQPQTSKRPTQPKNTSDKKGIGLSPLTRPLVGPQLDDYK